MNDLDKDLKDLDDKLIDSVFKLIDTSKINQINLLKDDLDFDSLGGQPNLLFNELHEFVISICLSNDSNASKSNQFKKFKPSVDLKQYLVSCDVLNDYLFEQMNKGKWFKISIKSRIAYGLIILYYVLIRLYEFRLNKIKVDDCDFNDSILSLLNKIDNGLIYSPPFLDNLLAKCATVLHNYLIVRLPIQDDYNQIYSAKYLVSSNNHLIDKSKAIKRVKSIDLNDFYENYFLKKIPCIIESAIDDWPAVHKWNLNYLLNKSAYRLIPVEIGIIFSNSFS